MSVPTLEKSIRAQQQGVQTVLNAFVLESDSLQWTVNVYRVERLSTGSETTSGARDLKKILYAYARASRLRGAGPFWIMDGLHIAAPVGCVLKDTEDFQGHRITRTADRIVVATATEHDGLTREILKSATRDVLKRGSNLLGDLIQDGDRFVERPSSATRHGHLHYCRRYELRPRVIHLHGGVRRWAIQLVVETVSLDARSIQEYYQQGEVEALAHLIRAKRRNRRSRDGRPTAIRALYLPEGSFGSFGPLIHPEQILEDAEYRPSDQQSRASEPHLCELFQRGELTAVPLPGDALYLVLDTQVTGEHHDETILEVPLRLELYQEIQAVLQGTEAYGVLLVLSSELAGVATHIIPPPALKLKGRVLSAPLEVTSEALSERYRTRAAHVRTHGYLYTPSNINPLVVVPKNYGKERGQQLVQDLQAVSDAQGLEVRIAGPVVYTTLEDIKSQLGRHDALIAVLPEGKRRLQQANDLHEQIKKGLSVNSQCIQHDNTRRLSEDTPRQRRNARFNLEAVLLNLLVKHGWVPFLPAEPSQYNVHFGIDVGGVLNNRVMVCLGYGFEDATPIFHAEEIHVEGSQAEPIQDGPLYTGMMTLLDRIRQVIVAKSLTPNFNRVLFFRDGDSTGEAGVWQESDAFSKLHQEFLKQGWIDDQASWVLVEISKRAAGWRQFRQEAGRTLNPLVGTVSFPFGDPNQALLSTTGAPSLPQGTAQPLLVTMSSIAGTFNPMSVAQELIWEADLGFTKLDHGYALPLTLHIADTGALQLSKTYGISGLTL